MQPIGLQNSSDRTPTRFRLQALLQEDGPAWPASFSAHEGELLLAEGCHAAAARCLEAAFTAEPPAARLYHKNCPAFPVDRTACLLSARVANLRRAQCAGESLAASRAATHSVNAALLCEPAFAGVEAAAWRQAFGPTAAGAASHGIDVVLAAVGRRIRELDTERAAVQHMEDTTGLDRSGSGAFRRSTADAVDEDGVPIPEQVSQDISEARPRHLLRPPARVARQGLASLLDATVSVSSRTALVRVARPPQRRLL